MINDGQSLKEIIEYDKYENEFVDIKIEQIREELHPKLDEVLRTGIPETTEGFDGIKALLTDRYGANTTVEKTFGASTLEIRNMLAAA